MLTSTASSARRSEREAAGIRRCLHKPVRRADLATVIGHLLGRAPAGPAVTVPAADQAIAPLQGSVLLAEDNPVNQLLAKAMLAKLGVQVSLAQNGQEAIDRVAAQQFDLVLMDCQMPVMDGYQATAAIRAQTANRPVRLPIVAVTANAVPGDERRCLDAGMDAFLAKPFMLQQLRDVLAQWLPGTIEARSRPSVWRLTAPARESDAASTEAINLRTLEFLRRLDPAGGEELVARVLRAFLESADASLRCVQHAIQASDSTRLTQAAHTLKSSTANIGAEVLATLYQRLETASREGRMEEVQALLAAVEREQARAIVLIRAILGTSALKGAPSKIVPLADGPI
jgi:two-component system, sensor histidine kinase and response regulator